MAIEKIEFAIPKPVSSKEEKSLFDFTYKLALYSNKVNLDDKHPSCILVTISIDTEKINKDDLNDFIKGYYVGHKSF